MAFLGEVGVKSLAGFLGNEYLLVAIVALTFCDVQIFAVKRRQRQVYFVSPSLPMPEYSIPPSSLATS